ncbi:hypothetical protein SADUNF_Sadunf01G0166200 [Salix dunnii]|uniref:Uncharacterized protein n=1 Tax=Salix dunnii TaxID=1413687 RepID=A0A835TNY5_9ROSI|nr:hypothetical protein SADUNF_Sadunf01G0166200 [Salix dunnii]
MLDPMEITRYLYGGSSWVKEIRCITMHPPQWRTRQYVHLLSAQIAEYLNGVHLTSAQIIGYLYGVSPQTVLGSRKLGVLLCIHHKEGLINRISPLILGLWRIASNGMEKNASS